MPLITQDSEFPPKGIGWVLTLILLNTHLIGERKMLRNNKCVDLWSLAAVFHNSRSCLLQGKSPSAPGT